MQRNATVGLPLAVRQENSVPKKEKHSSSTLRGKIVSFNISPKGHVEGALVSTSAGLAQINFPKHSPEFARTTSVGANVEFAAKREPDEGDHPVYTVQDDAGDVSGKIVRLNYALHGEVNGYHLDDGTFVHVKPEGAKKYKLRVGEKVRAHGARRAGADAPVLEARSLEKLGGHH